MNKVALINPGKLAWHAMQEPLNIGYIASYLEKNNIEVKIFDQLAGQDIEKEIKNYAPNIVGITSTTMFVYDAYQIADFCRDRGILTVMGGVHVSVLPEEALQHVDIVVKGEGELSMLDIVNDNIESKIITRPYIKNIDEIPPPARHLMQMDFYLHAPDRLPGGTHLGFVPRGKKVAGIITSRGCPYSCIFCHNSWKGIPVRYRSPVYVVEEILYLIARYKIDALFFFDDEFFRNKKRLKEICELMRKNKIKLIWGCQARSDTVDMEALEMVRDVGCCWIGFGFESGSQRILDILKTTAPTVEQNRKAIDLCRKVGIKCHATYMLGNPTETIEDLKATFEFVKKNKTDTAGFFISTPFPGTKLWQWCKEHNLIPEKIDWSKFTTGEITIFACDTISPEIVLKFREKMVNYFLALDFYELLLRLIKRPTKIVQIIFHPKRYFEIFKMTLLKLFEK